MSGQLFKTLQRSSLLDGGNVAYLESLYETWLQDQDAVAPHWRDYFGALPAVNGQVRADLSHAGIRAEFSRLTGRLRGHRIARMTGARLAHQGRQVRVGKDGPPHGSTPPNGPVRREILGDRPVISAPL